MAIDYTKRPQPEEPKPAAGGVSLSKVTLTKAAPAVSLTKQGSTGGVLRVNLNWNARPAGQPAGGGGFLKRLTQAAAGGGAIDLDLGCLYEYADGSKGVVQALGNAFRDQHSYGGDPICWLDGDDRSGTNSGGENLFVDLARAGSVRRILVFAFIYQGVPNWAAADAVVTLFPASETESLSVSLAAAPGTSKHGWGMATDLNLNSEAQAWMRSNAGAFGFVEDTPREPWHWGYHPTH